MSRSALYKDEYDAIRLMDFYKFIFCGNKKYRDKDLGPMTSIASMIGIPLKKELPTETLNVNDCKNHDVVCLDDTHNMDVLSCNTKGMLVAHQ